MSENLFQAPELLCEIFLYLSQQDLLLVQRVCRTWCHVIRSSKALQIALFFLPDCEDSKTGMSLYGTSRVQKLNPLLLDRFPGFFDPGEDPVFQQMHRATHTVVVPARSYDDLPKEPGPWNSTDWFRGRSKAEPPPRSPEDKQRMAAYIRAEASWRHMIPCQPAPRELQMSFSTLHGGVLRILTFANMESRNQEEKWTGNNNCSVLFRHWLTFGLLYDIIEQSWFHHSPPLRGNIWFDYFCRTQHEMYKPYNHAGSHTDRLTNAFPHRKIGGVERVVVHLSLWSSRPRPPRREYHDVFRSEASVVADLKWDEEIKFEYRRLRLGHIPQVEEG